MYKETKPIYMTFRNVDSKTHNNIEHDFTMEQACHNLRYINTVNVMPHNALTNASYKEKITKFELILQLNINNR